MSIDAVSSSLSVPRYDAAEVSRWLSMEASRVRRWLQGYEYKYRGEAVRQPPVVLRKGQGHGTEHGGMASFLDVVELRYAKTFLDAGFSLARIRKVLVRARQVTGEPHPFATRKFYSTGSDVFVDLGNGPDETAMMSLLNDDQHGIAPVILEIAAQFDFSRATEVAEKWWPDGKGVPVVIDPQRGFGRPTVANTGVRTEVLYDAWIAEGDFARVARTYQLAPDIVEQAVAFEKRLSVVAA